MLTTLKRYWQALSGGESDAVVRPAGGPGSGTFRLVLRDVPVGTLSYEDGRWVFEYTDQFRTQKDLRPLVAFPEVGRRYVSDALWPFFGMRIPSLKQPAVKQAVAAEHLDEGDRVQLLRRFGRRTVVNPYELVPQEPAR